MQDDLWTDQAVTELRDYGTLRLTENASIGVWQDACVRFQN